MPSTRLIELLTSPETVSTVSDWDWNDIVLAARKNQLTGQLAAQLQRANQIEQIPIAVRRHLDLETLTSKRRGESALWEIATIRRAVDARFPLILLKGCAYLATGDDNSQGRLFSDIDVMVRQADLPGVETNLVAVGWKPGSVSAYDAAYYRNWMHEVPPMAHVRRHTVVDLHHAINPPISRYYVNPALLFKNLETISPGIFVLSPTDRIVHCALHLLQEGESRKLLRDLFDLFLLLEQHHGDESSTSQLMKRAVELNVDRPVTTAINAARAIFGRAEIQKAAGLDWLGQCVRRSALGAHGSPGLTSGFAATALLAHSHWMKMPINILVPHLLRKSMLRPAENKAAHL